MCVYCENQVFLIVLSMTGNQSKTKTILHTVSETFINTNSRYKTQKVSWWILWKIIEILHTAKDPRKTLKMGKNEKRKV